MKRKGKMKRGVFFMMIILIIGTATIFAADNTSSKIAAVPNNNGEKMSFDLKDIDIVELLRILSLKTGKTIVPGKEVSGRISLYVNNVTFQDVLDIVLLTQNLAYQKEGNIFYIMSASEYKKVYGKDYKDNRKLKTIKLSYAKPANVFNALSQLKSDNGKIIADEASGTIIMIDVPESLEVLEKSIKGLDQALETTVYDLNYAKPADAKTHLTAAITPGTGEVIVDERSGKAIVTDLPEKMEKISRLVKELDEESRQVFIEADIVEVTLSDKHERGIDWEKIFSERSLDGLDLAGSFPLALSAFQKIAVGTLATNRYNAVINFLETYGDTKVISQPRIAVINNQEAKIMVGTREAYITSTLSQAETTTVTSESVEFVDVGVKLNVTPAINKEGFITIKIKPEVSSIKETITTSAGSRIPIVQTSEAETTVKVKDGAMIMIAGLIKEEKSDDINGLPVISRIPILGSILGNRTKEVKRSEVIIFLRPRLMSGDVALKGMEPEKNIPRDMMSGEVKEKVERQEEIGKTVEKTEKQQVKIEARQAALEKQKQSAAEKEVKRQKALEEACQKEQGNILVKLSEAQRKEELEKQKTLEEEKKKIDVKKNFVPVKKAKLGAATIFAEDKASSKMVAVPIIKGDGSQKRTVSVVRAERARAWYQKGLQEQANGSWDKAREHYNRALLIDKNYAPAYNQLGILAEMEGRLGEAEEMYLKAVKADSNYPAVYSNLALVNESKNNFAKAAEYWQKRAVLGDKNDPWTKQAEIRAKELSTSALN